MAAYEILLLNTAIPQIQAAQSGDTYLCPRELAVVVNTATDAVRITQTGTGNALLVEDSANPDSSPFVVTATGDVGIGTSSPTNKLEVASSTTNTGITIFNNNASGGQNARLGFKSLNGYDSYSVLAAVTAVPNAFGNTATSLVFSTSGDNSAASAGLTERMRLDSSGNLGLGVTPSAWFSGVRVLQFGTAGVLFSNSDRANLASNVYIDSGTVSKYIGDGFALRYAQENGQHVWYNAPSGTADGTAATSLTSAQNGNSYTIKVAGTTDFTLIGAANNNVGTTFTKSGGTGAGTGTVSQNIFFTQAMTLTSGGNQLVGTTSDPGHRLVVVSANSASQLAARFNGTDGTNSAVFDIAGSGIDPVLEAVGARNLLFRTNSAERARITSGGIFQVSSGGSVQVGGTAARATTAGTNRLDIFNGTAPVGTLTDGISIYSSSGEAYVMDAAGNATLFSPHDAETNEWIFKSKHTPTGKVLKIDVERLLKFVNDHFGLDAVHEFVEK